MKNERILGLASGAKTRNGQSQHRWIMQELRPASVKVPPKDVMTMEPYKIEVNTPKIPKKRAVVQNIEQQVAILLHGKHKGQKKEKKS